MRLSFNIAKRFLASNKAQTALIALGIGIGIAVQIFIGSLIEGLQISLVDATIGRSAHMVVKPSDETEYLENYPKLLETVSQNVIPLTALTPTLTRGGFLKRPDDTYYQMLYRGFDLSRAEGIYKFSESLVAGEMPGVNAVLVGTQFAEKNALEVGDTVTLQSPSGNTHEVTVSGIFDFKVDAINTQWVVGSLENGHALFEQPDDATSAIELQVEEPFEVEALTQSLSSAVDTDYLTVDNWQLQNAQLLSGLTGQNTSSLMIQIFVILSVVLGIASVLAVTVLQKSKQLGILKAMGITDRNAGFVFLFEGLILGIIGGIIGIAIGIGLLYIFQTFALKPDGTPVVPIYINPGFIGFSGLLAVVASTLAAVLPARNSKKLTPIEVIRNA